MLSHERGSEDVGRAGRTTVQAGASDAELVTTARLGADRPAREAAFRCLLERHWRPLVMHLETRMRSRKDAEELAHEAFVRAWRSLPSLSDPQAFVGWLLRIARNLVVDQSRRRRSDRPLEALEAESVRPAAGWWNEAPSVEERLEDTEDYQRIRHALGELPERYRSIVILRFLEGRSNRELARTLGEPEGTIRNRVFRALAKLRVALGVQEDAGRTDSRESSTIDGQRPGPKP